MMFKVLLAALLALFLQDADGIGKRVKELLDSEFGKLNQDIEKLVKEELAKKPQDSTAVKPTIDVALGNFTKESIREIVSTIASDEYEGRCAGFPGNDKTTEYFAGIYKKAGLKPVGDDGSYFQHFTISGRKTRNTIAVLEGTDLKDEFVIIGGHHDHLGKGRQGPAMQKLGGATGDDEIWNGADDNGSGSSTIVAMAKAFGESGLKPRRSIVFMTFSGEEWGLLGSAHYVDHPIVPLEKTIAMINIDMIGRNPNRPVDVKGLGTEEGDMFERLIEKHAKRVGIEVKMGQEHTVMGGDSDHSNFRSKKVPVMFFFTGIHADYHKVSDHVDKLSIDNMQKIGHCAALTLWDLANQDAKPKFTGKGGGGMDRLPGFDWPSREEKPAKKERKLGFLPSYKFTMDEMDKVGLGEKEGGILVESVSDDGVAAKAGVKAGDIIVAVDGKPLPRPMSEALKELKNIIGAAKAKAPVPITVLRGKEKVELKAEFPE